jgi:hypothetical protein
MARRGFVSAPPGSSRTVTSGQPAPGKVQSWGTRDSRSRETQTRGTNRRSREPRVSGSLRTARPYRRPGSRPRSSRERARRSGLMRQQPTRASQGFEGCRELIFDRSYTTKRRLDIPARNRPDGRPARVPSVHRQASGIGSRRPAGPWVADVGLELSDPIFGKRDAVLVDTLLTIDRGAKLADQNAASGKNLTYIHLTHGHADHSVGINTLKHRVPNLRAVATASVVDRRASQFAPDVIDGIFRRLSPGQIPDDPSMAESLDGHPSLPRRDQRADTTRPLGRAHIMIRRAQLRRPCRRAGCRPERRISRDNRGQRSSRSATDVPKRERTERRIFARRWKWP